MQSVDVVKVRAKIIYILMIKVKFTVFFLLLQNFLNEMENMFFVNPWKFVRSCKIEETLAYRLEFL